MGAADFNSDGIFIKISNGKILCKVFSHAICTGVTDYYGGSILHDNDFLSDDGSYRYAEKDSKAYTGEFHIKGQA